VYSKAQEVTLARIAGADWRVLAVHEGDVWIAKQGRLRKVFSRIDAHGALLSGDRLEVVKVFGKAKAIRLVDDAFSLEASVRG